MQFKPLILGRQSQECVPSIFSVVQQNMKLTLCCWMMCLWEYITEAACILQQTRIWHHGYRVNSWQNYLLSYKTLSNNSIIRACQVFISKMSAQMADLTRCSDSYIVHSFLREVSFFMSMRGLQTCSLVSGSDNLKKNVPPF